VNVFASSVTFSGFGRVVLFSFLATQLIVWLFEIRAVGLRTWMRESMKHSYFGYIRRYGLREWRFFASVFGAVFVTFALIWGVRQ